MASIREPIHLFSIPLSITNSLTLRGGPNYRSSVDLPPIESSSIEPSTSTSVPNASSLTCTTCSGATFVDVNEQRIHFRSDWHRYNVKIRLQNPTSKPVTEAEFGDLVEGQLTLYIFHLSRSQLHILTDFLTFDVPALHFSSFE